MKQPVERRLAAILAADAVGYSRLMGEDEEGEPHQRQPFNSSFHDTRSASVRPTSVQRRGGHRRAGHVDRSSFVGNFAWICIGCAYGIRIGEVRILSPTPAMIIVGVAASPSVM